MRVRVFCGCSPECCYLTCQRSVAQLLSVEPSIVAVLRSGNKLAWSVDRTNGRAAANGLPLGKITRDRLVLLPRDPVKGSFSLFSFSRAASVQRPACRRPPIGAGAGTLPSG